MSVRGIGDAFAFQRLLWLLVGTIVVPTVLLTLYGVMAIRNQQAAIEEQVRRDQQERVGYALGELYARVDALDRSVRAAVSACSLPCGPAVEGLDAAWGWSGDPPAALAGAELPSPTADGPTMWALTPDGSALGVFTLADRQGAWRLDRPAIAALGEHTRRVGRERFPDGVDFALREIRAGPATPVADLMARWERDDFEAGVVLERPLARWELVLSYPDNDPVRAILGPTRWLYPMGLVALVATVMAGTVITLNSAAREIRLSRLQTDFVSNVSHELRTPLTSIRLFVETLQSGRIEDPERVRECLDLLSQETDRLSRMIERVLSWARMEAGRRPYTTHRVPVRDLVADALAALRSQTLTQPTEAVRVQLDAPDVQVDRDAIVEALVNLLQNAVKYTPSPREIAVTTSTRGGMVGITVSDNGPGIAKADRSRIFEKFYQADTRLSAPMGAQRGSGLGLAIVRAVVRGHGGSVELQTELGEGSRFTLWLPAAG